jgi:hypothetical protein
VGVGAVVRIKPVMNQTPMLFGALQDFDGIAGDLPADPAIPQGMVYSNSGCAASSNPSATYSPLTTTSPRLEIRLALEDLVRTWPAAAQGFRQQRSNDPWSATWSDSGISLHNDGLRHRLAI